MGGGRRRESAKNHHAIVIRVHTFRIGNYSVGKSAPLTWVG